jgi:hypothetical protein
VQQGMNPAEREARRYHWQSENMVDFFQSPHAAIEGRNVGDIVNLAERQADLNRSASLDLVREGPDRLIAILRRFAGRQSPNRDLFDSEDAPSAGTAGEGNLDLKLPSRHDVRAADIDLKKLHATLAAASDRGPKDFAELLLSPGVGARTLASVAFVAEVIHGAPYRFKDPARFALAHGGKDGHPFPVPLKVYDETIAVLKRAVDRASLGSREKLDAIKRLDDQARVLEGIVSGPSLADYVAAERVRSLALGGRSVN